MSDEPTSPPSISSAAGSPVSPSLLPASDSPRMTPGGSGPSLHESFAHYDPASLVAQEVPLPEHAQRGLGPRTDFLRAYLRQHWLHLLDLVVTAM